MLPALRVRLGELVQPWADLYSDSTPVQTGVTYVHLAGLFGAGGFAIATDRLALRLSREEDRATRGLLLRELSAVHRPVLAGLMLVTVTGILMALADLEFIATSPVFWLKMAAFVALLINGVSLQRAEHRLERGDGEEMAIEPVWGKLRGASRRSMALWALTLLLGTILTSA